MVSRGLLHHSRLCLSCASESCMYDFQGKFCHLGLFPDPVSAATFYDRQAMQIRGDRALLNFPPGCTPARTSSGVPGDPLAVTGGGGRGLKRPAANGLLPAGEVEGDMLTAPGPQVGLTCDRLASRYIRLVWRLTQHHVDTASCLSPTHVVLSHVVVLLSTAS
jgi:hypothetical protein